MAVLRQTDQAVEGLLLLYELVDIVVVLDSLDRLKEQPPLNNGDFVLKREVVSNFCQ